jgi:hypothetical protein
MMMMERDAAARALRLLRGGTALTLTAVLDVRSGPAYTAHNVIGEVRGSTRPDEIVVIGAHLDSWDLGTGALDNGANSAMVIDIARQIARLGIRPARTIRFALWNGEEQNLNGSYGYTLIGGERDAMALPATSDWADHLYHRRAPTCAGADRALAPATSLGCHAGQRPHR